MESELQISYRNKRFFSSLDGLRCISIVAVIWHHTAAKAFSSPISQQGYQGVTLFFTISGFLITTLLLREKEAKGTISLNKFYMRRTLRIFPLYYSIVLVYIVITKIVEGNSIYGLEFYSNIKYYVSYTSNWFIHSANDRIIFFFAWSLATEEQFYLLWPSVERVLSGWLSVYLAFALIVFSQLAQFGLLSSFIASPFVVRVVANISTTICLGVILAHILHENTTFKIVEKILGNYWSPAVGLFSSVTLLFYVTELGPIGELLLALSFTFLVGSCVIREDTCATRVLVLKPLVWIGTISYGMYLLHMLSANVAKRLLPSITGSYPLAYFVLTLLVATAVASFSYLYYESFFLRIKHRFAVK